MLLGKWCLEVQEGRGSFPKLGVPFLGVHYNKDYSILGSLSGSPYSRELPCIVLGSLLQV